MQDIISHISEEGGGLSEASGVYVQGLDPGESKMLVGIVLKFESGTLPLFVTDDDELTIVKNFDVHSPTEGHFCESIGSFPPWRDVLGASVLWGWVLVNQQGYTDGMQFEFLKPTGESAVVQLLAVAGEILMRTMEVVAESDKP